MTQNKERKITWPIFVCCWWSKGAVAVISHQSCSETKAAYKTSLRLLFWITLRAAITPYNWIFFAHHECQTLPVMLVPKLIIILMMIMILTSSMSKQSLQIPEWVFVSYLKFSEHLQGLKVFETKLLCALVSFSRAKWTLRGFWGNLDRIHKFVSYLLNPKYGFTYLCFLIQMHHWCRCAYLLANMTQVWKDMGERTFTLYFLWEC